MKERLDKRLVDLQLVDSRSKAQSLILAGAVIVDDHRVDKAGTLVSLDAEIRLKKETALDVSRAGAKLRAAIEQWPYNIHDQICMDVGASTGGFSDVLLQHGAQKVYAIDVGHNQLHWKLRQDPRIISMEKTHIVHLELGALNPPPKIAVIDVSFISLRVVLPATLQHLLPDSVLYTLIKPQFEGQPRDLKKGGIVKDEHTRERIKDELLSDLHTLPIELVGLTHSPIEGRSGNIEYIARFNYRSKG
jgi:23S rRNA (cytidine1920-2'-O)/16S rRNA (cytidine1409-2'-O)-methyltransferase